MYTLKTSNGEIITDTDDRCKVWKHYSETLFDDQNCSLQNQISEAEGIE